MFVLKQGAKENIWTCERKGTGRWRMSHSEEVLCISCALCQILLEYDFK